MAKTPKNKKTAGPELKHSEIAETQLVRAAYEKINASETPNAQERSALKRFERSQEETKRWQHYSSIPQKHWREMSGRQAKILNEQAERYQIPFGGAVIDLPAVVKRLHDFLADNAGNLTRVPEGGAGETPLAIDPRVLKALGDGTDAIAVSRAAMHIASRRLCDAIAGGRAGAGDFDNLKRTLAELRQAESDYLDLEKEKKTLMARDDVCSIVALCCSRLVRVFEVLENSIAAEVAVWLADPAVREMATEDRKRMVREYVAKTGAEVRRQEADGVDKLIEAITVEEGAT